MAGSVHAHGPPQESKRKEKKRKEKKRKDIECYRRVKALDGWECWMLGYSRGYRETRCIPVLYRPKVVEVKCSSKLLAARDSPALHIPHRLITRHLKKYTIFGLKPRKYRYKKNAKNPPKEHQAHYKSNLKTHQKYKCPK